MSRDSGAGAYVQSFGTGARSRLRSSSVKGEVVRALIAPGRLLPELHEDVVQERRRADAVAIRCEPVRPQCLVHEHEMLDRVLRDPHAAGGLEANGAAGLLVDVADRLEHAERDRTAWVGDLEVGGILA